MTLETGYILLREFRITSRFVFPEAWGFATCNVYKTSTSKLSKILSKNECNRYPHGKMLLLISHLCCTYQRLDFFSFIKNFKYRPYWCILNPYFETKIASKLIRPCPHVCLFVFVKFFFAQQWNYITRFI